MYKRKPASLHKCNAHETLEKQLSISAKELIIIFILVLIFGLFCFFSQGPTMGYL